MCSNEVLNELKELRKEMNDLKKAQERSMIGDEKMNEMNNEMKGMREALDFMNDKFEKVMKELQETRDENKKIKKDMITMMEKVSIAEAQIAELKNEQLRENIEISGIPCMINENCHTVALSVLKQVQPSINRDDIVEAYRLGGINDREGRPRMNRNMLVKLKQKKTRNEIYKNKKKLKDIDTVQMGLSTEKKKVFINEHLSRETRLLFYSSMSNTLRREK